MIEYLIIINMALLFGAVMFLILGLPFIDVLFKFGGASILFSIGVLLLELLK